MRLVVPYTKKEKYPSLPLFFPFAPENQSDNLNIEIL